MKNIPEWLLVIIMLVMIFLLLWWYFIKPEPPPPPTKTTEPPAPTATYTPVPTDTPEPTAVVTDEPTATPEPTEAPEPTATPEPTEIVAHVRAGGYAHLRQGPSKSFLPLWWYGEDYAIIGGWLPDGTPLIVLGCQAPAGYLWVEVDYLGRSGYIYAPLLDLVICD